MSGSTGEQPAVTPTVSTAPARSRWSKLPDHLGRARTSTLVLGILFLAIGTLYLNIRPETTGTASTSGETVDQQPATTTSPAAPTTAESTTPAPETTDSEPTTTEEPTTGTTTGTTDVPSDEPTGTGEPTTTLPATPTAPTTSSPAG
jgi:cytoskeletal protein RodZ